MLSKMNTRRWIAVGIAVLILGISAISAGISSRINAEARMEEFASLIQDQFDDGSLGEETLMEGDEENRIAVLPVHGTIMDMGSAYSGLTVGYDHETFIDSLYQAAEDDTVKGILLDVDSPGGGVYESAEIYHHIQEIREITDKPIWTFMGNMAASGGYYIAAPSDRIIATPETLTGSIGVIMSHTNIQGLYEKLGIEQDPIKSAPMKDIGASYRDMTEEEREVMQTLIDNMYGRFVDVVAQGRGMSQEEVRRIGDGRIYDGYQAQEIGLVDEIAFYDQALDSYIEDLGLEDPQVFQYTAGGLNPFFSFFNRASLASLETNLIKETLDSIQAQGPRPLYLYGGE